MTEQMKKKIEQFCIANDLLHKKDGIVVGVSGGADSVFFDLFLKEIRNDGNFVFMLCILIMEFVGRRHFMMNNIRKN